MGRRASDEILRETYDRTSKWRRMTATALALWAIIATVAVSALTLQGIRNTEALDKASHAFDRANVAVSIVMAQQARQHTQLIGACIRLNVLRASDNLSHLGDYRIDAFVTQRFLVPTKTETAAQKRVTAQFASALRRTVAEKEWTPLTDCAAAVASDAAKHRTPSPIRFAVHPPPASATNAKNAGLLTPAGSVR